MSLATGAFHRQYSRNRGRRRRSLHVAGHILHRWKYCNYQRCEFRCRTDLRIIEGIGGDYNGNGIVDAADYSVWRDHLGQAFQLQNEGPDTPGEVTAEDYDFWKANFGLGSPGSASGGTIGGPGSLPVPEPGALVLLLGASGMLLLRPKTRAFPHVFGSVKKATINLETA